MISRLVKVGVARGAEAPERVLAAAAGWLARGAAPPPGTVMLATCGRTELYGLETGNPADPRCDAAWRAVFRDCCGLPPGADRDDREDGEDGVIPVARGAAVAHHLFRVAAGVLSPLLGESEILGQVRQAHTTAETRGPLDPVLGRLFQAALAAGRTARQESGLGGLTANWAGLATAAVTAALGTAGTPLASARIVVAGSGQAALTTALQLTAKGASHLCGGVIVACRHPARAAAAGFATLPLEAVSGAPWEALVTALRTPRPWFGAGELAAAPVGRVVVDLGLPPNVDAAAARARGLVLVGLEQLLPAGPPAAAVLATTEAVLARELERFTRWATSRQLLVLAAHGAGDGSAANQAVTSLAHQVGQLLPDTEVTAAFQRGHPGYGEVLDRHTRDNAPRPAVVVPVFLADGYFSRQRLPTAMVGNRAAAVSPLRFTPPLGIHPRLAAVRVAQVGEALRHAPSETDWDVLVVGHGTARHPASRGSTFALVAALQAAYPAAAVQAAFLDDEPAVEGVVARLTRPRLLVVPQLLGGGGHATTDLASHLTAARGQVTRLPALIEDRGGEGLGELARVAAELATPARCLRLGSRGSRLALVQAARVAAELERRGVAVVVVPWECSGDRDLSRPITELPGDAPFADDLEAALLAGELDLVVHSLKDLALTPTPGLTLAAFLPRGPVAEALVSRDGRPLAALAPGTRVGTSSARRAAQLVALAPGLVPVPMRGPVDARVAAVERGAPPAALLALAGLERLGLTERVAEVLPLGSFLPAPGQGVLVAQARQNDERTRAHLAALDDPATRAAAGAEVAFARLVDGAASAWTSAAWAGRAAHGEVRLQARWITRDGRQWRDVTVVGCDPDAVAHEAARRLGLVLDRPAEREAA